MPPSQGFILTYLKKKKPTTTHTFTYAHTVGIYLVVEYTDQYPDEVAKIEIESIKVRQFGKR